MEDETQKRRSREAQRRLREERRAQGLCVSCGRPRHPESKSQCLRCRKRDRKATRRRRGSKAKSLGPTRLEER